MQERLQGSLQERLQEILQKRLQESLQESLRESLESWPSFELSATMWRSRVQSCRRPSGSEMIVRCLPPILRVRCNQVSSLSKRFLI
jgi:hypothetical protein